MNRKRKAYLLAGIFFILVAVGMVSYPLGEYYFGRYMGSSHDVSTGNFTYVFNIPVKANNTWGWVMPYSVVYHFQGLGNGKFNFTAIIYNNFVGYGTTGQFLKVDLSKNWRRPFILGKNETVKKVAEVHAILNSTDPLIRFLFPKDSVYLHEKNRKLVPYHGFFSDAAFLPRLYGFGRFYVPQGFGGSSRIQVLREYKLEYPVRYYKGSDRYYAFWVILAAKPNLTYINYLELQRFVGNPLHINITKRTIIPYGYESGSILLGGSMSLVQSSIQPKVQDWTWAFKYSFQDYAAPVDYVLILIGLILLVLAGRAKG